MVDGDVFVRVLIFPAVLSTDHAQMQTTPLSFFGNVFLDFDPSKRNLSNVKGMGFSLCWILRDFPDVVLMMLSRLNRSQNNNE